MGSDEDRDLAVAHAILCGYATGVVFAIALWWGL